MVWLLQFKKISFLNPQNVGTKAILTTNLGSLYDWSTNCIYVLLFYDRFKIRVINKTILSLNVTDVKLFQFDG
jgi:hypothetical protein